MVTGYDCWRPGPVAVPEIMHLMAANIGSVQTILRQLVADILREHMPCPIGSDAALEWALTTAPVKRDPALLAKLDARPVV